MTRIMFDAIYPANAPAGAAIYAGYVGGSWPDFAAMEQAHPGKLYVSIAVNATERAKMLDVETGDATPAQAPGWTEDQRRAGDPYPWVYCNTSTWPTVIAEFTAQKIAPPLYVVAAYSSSPPDLAHPPTIPAGAIGLQAYDYGPYDISFMADHIPGFDPDPTPVPAPVPQEDDDMQQIEPLSAHPGIYNFPTVNKGHFRLTVGDGGTADVRAVAWDGVGNALVLCGDKNDGAVKKGARDFAISAATVAFVTVQRRDTGSFPIGVTVY